MNRRDNKYSWNKVILHYLGERCTYCGSIEKLHIHHMIPLELGGSHTLSNLEVVCDQCHYNLHKTWDKFISTEKKPEMNYCENCSNYFSSRFKAKTSICKPCKKFLLSKKVRKDNK